MSATSRPPPSPLGLIRQFERELALKRATLEEELRAREEAADDEAERIRAEGCERGRLAARRRHEESIRNAKRAAKATHEAAVAAAASIRREAAPHLDDAVEAMVALVLPAREVG